MIGSIYQRDYELMKALMGIYHLIKQGIGYYHYSLSVTLNRVFTRNRIG